MSKRYSDSDLERKPLFLDESFQEIRITSSREGPGSQDRSPAVADIGAVSGSSPPNNGSSRVVLSTDSPAAMKLGQQQIIPNKLAVVSKPKVRVQQASTLPSRKNSGRREVHSMPPSQFRYEDGKDQAGQSGTLSRNRRNMSYKVATSGTNDFGDERNSCTLPASVTGLKVPDPVAVQPPRSPGRSKRTIGKRKIQKGRSSFKDDPRLYQQIWERGLEIIGESDDDLLDDPVPPGPTQPDQRIVVQNYRPVQMTWSQLPQVQDKGILESLTAEERKRQEAIFEIIVSEFSYQHSLDVLIRMFKNSQELQKTMTTIEHHHLFSNISDVKEASKRFFEDLEERHKSDPVINDISDIIEYHATKCFEPYVVYCSNETYQQKTLQKLLSSNVTFKEILQQIQVKSDCGSLPIISFLILPMQRVTRLPLLMDTICQKTNPNVPEYESATRALKAISKLVKQCNEGARKMERMEQMCTIQTQLEFGKIKGFALISASRWLKKRGELSVPLEDSGIFRKGSGKQNYYLFLFNDVLIVTRKRSEENYIVQNHAKLENVQVEVVETNDSPNSPPGKAALTGTLPRALPNINLFKIIMTIGPEEKEQIVLNAESLSDRARWMDGLQSKQRPEKDDLANKEGLPQVEVIKAYWAKQPDELSLQLADVVIVLQEVDGWYQGERIRDSERGWFPQTSAKEITNQAAVQKNVKRKQRLRLETDV
ncbi:rho guanine nucleotide exchange factor 16 [Callorhinchus milii]|uniref:Rho guanine nucleotide exchange factor (GEF) 16 n=2 Tax=Callorhinchus milii TaxID=7868 RepID=A0A4W3GWS2_CALMI|nr:rho guanine nucleotide exchange factor 16 [Callorhinchus milii]|eukprot:gi/632967981/ref/XP_007900279.1/ PREDICTED: rho guanine nucleotide exchange factor 16 [Callorhinchus milii]